MSITYTISFPHLPSLSSNTPDILSAIKTRGKQLCINFGNIIVFKRNGCEIYLIKNSNSAMNELMKMRLLRLKNDILIIILYT